MPVNTVARHLGVGDDAIWRVLHHYVEAARAKADFSAVCAVGIDETQPHAAAGTTSACFMTWWRGECSTVVRAAIRARKRSLPRTSAPTAGRQNKSPPCASTCPRAYIAGVHRSLPQASITFDTFHIIQLANEAVDQVRREEVREQPLLKHSRWTWLEDKRRWSNRQIVQSHDLAHSRLQTARAWRLKESLRDPLATAQNPEQAKSLFERWHSWARRCRLAPMKRLAATLKTHLQGLLNDFVSHLSNGRVEGINSLIQAATARARGYRTTRSLITMDPEKV